MLWLQITAGRGPEECCWAVARLLYIILDQAAERGITTKVLETIPGPRKDTLKSALIALEGEDSQVFAREWEGSVMWKGQSMFRPEHKRKNWFVGVRLLEQPQTVDYEDNQLKIETMRSTGHGGQHVNKTESAVRITHIPTGISATAREERSQHLNKKLAMTRLYNLIRQKAANEQRKSERKKWNGHNKLERGNPVKVFKVSDFKGSS